MLPGSNTLRQWKKIYIIILTNKFLMTGTYNLLLYFYIIVYIYFILVVNLNNTKKVNYSIMDKTKKSNKNRTCSLH